MAEITVHELNVLAEARWDFRDSKPRWQHGTFGSSTTFDPFPGYPHDLLTVQEAVNTVADTWRPLWDVEVYVADREEEGRSNGHSNLHEGGHYVDNEYVKNEPVGLIVLSGKRIPPHPAMTRYLVAHEYGHNVEWMLNKTRGTKYLHDDGLMKEYAELRGLPGASVHHGSGGRWHDSVTEIFACDFRVVICGVESAFWPHPGAMHPLDALDDLAGFAVWWDDQAAAWFNHTAGGADG